MVTGVKDELHPRELDERSLGGDFGRHSRHYFSARNVFNRRRNMPQSDVSRDQFTNISFDRRDMAGFKVVGDAFLKVQRQTFKNFFHESTSSVSGSDPERLQTQRNRSRVTLKSRPDR